MLVEIIGSLAAFTSTISLLPQIIKAHRTRSTDDLSIGMLLIFLLTSLLWAIYGLMIASYAVLIANVLMVLFSVWMLTLTYCFRRANA